MVCRTTINTIQMNELNIIKFPVENTEPHVIVTGGSGEITLSPSGLIYETTDVSGFSLFGIFGMEWDRIEGLVGLRYDNINYSGFNSKN